MCDNQIDTIGSFGIKVEPIDHEEIASTSQNQFTESDQISDDEQTDEDTVDLFADILPGISTVKSEPTDDTAVDPPMLTTCYGDTNETPMSDIKQDCHMDDYPEHQGRQGAAGASPIVSSDGKRLLCSASRTCSFTCTGNRIMRAHVRSCHGELDPYTHKVIKYARFECAYCPKQLISRANKAKHERSCTNNAQGLHLTAKTNGKHGFKKLPLCPKEGCSARFVEYNRMAEHFCKEHDAECQLVRAFFDTREECDIFRAGLAKSEGWRKKNDHGKGSFILYVCGEKSSASGSEVGKVCTSFMTEKTQYDGTVAVVYCLYHCH